jgi:RNA polymerase sigma factor (TIGR02999 family)
MNHDVTRILSEIQDGHADAPDRLLPLVYDELRRLAAAKLAQEKPGQTLQATALVHEAYLRLLGPEGEARYEGRGHFFAAAAEAMRRLLVERARRYQTQKRGAGIKQVELSQCDLVATGTPEQIVALDEALDNLAAEEPEGATLVKLVMFGGFSVEEAGQLAEMSRATAYRHWSYARAWLKTYLDMETEAEEKS